MYAMKAYSRRRYTSTHS